MKHELSRATVEKTRHVMCYRDRFYKDVPIEVRHRGPWQVLHEGDVTNLKPEYRRALARDGYAYIETHPVGFTVET